MLIDERGRLGGTIGSPRRGRASGIPAAPRPRHRAGPARQSAPVARGDVSSGPQGGGPGPHQGRRARAHGRQPSIPGVGRRLPGRRALVAPAGTAHPRPLLHVPSGGPAGREDRRGMKESCYLVVWWVCQTPQIALFDHLEAAKAAASVRNALMVTVTGTAVATAYVTFSNSGMLDGYIIARFYVDGERRATSGFPVAAQSTVEGTLVATIQGCSSHRYSLDTCFPSGDSAGTC